jgi:hypothetical protein
MRPKTSNSVRHENSASILALAYTVNLRS